MINIRKNIYFLRFIYNFSNLIHIHIIYYSKNGNKFKDINIFIYIIPIYLYINFPFKTRKPEIKNEEDFMRKMFHNDIYTNIN